MAHNLLFIRFIFALWSRRMKRSLIHASARCLLIPLLANRKDRMLIAMVYVLSIRERIFDLTTFPHGSAI